MKNFMLFALLFAALPVCAQTKITGNLDLENGASIRWKKPDGSGYVNIFTFDKDGTLRLCDDAFYYDATEAQRKQRVIEIRNPNTAYPDLRLPITRTSNINADSKLHLRSATFTETNDPSELNLVRTGTDDPKNVDENGPTAQGAVPGLIRWMSRKGKGLVKDAELIARSYGTGEKDHYGAVIFQVEDSRFPQKGGTLLVMKSGVRIGSIRGAGDGKTGAPLEVDCIDDRPMILRRSAASTTQPVMLALASGPGGSNVDESNVLGMIKASPQASGGSRIEIQTKESALVLPVPAAQIGVKNVQRIASGELIAMKFDQTRFDNDAIYDVKAPTRLTCRTAGRYAISAAVEFAANGKGSRQVVIRRNGREVVAATRVAAVDGDTTQITFTAPPIDLKPGDYVELLVRQTSGEEIEIPATGQLPATFAMMRVG